MKKTSMVLILMFAFVSIILVGCSISNDKADDTNANYYIGETMRYDNIDVTILSVSETSSNQNYTIKVAFKLTNNNTKEFSFNHNCFDIRTEDKNEIYNTEQTLFSRSLMAGGTAEYWLEFITPYSITAKNFVMYFDWGVTHKEQPYKLYKRCYVDKTLDFQFNEAQNCYYVNGLGGYDKEDLIIPEAFNDIPVKGISSSAFAGNKNLKSYYKKWCGVYK